MSFVNTRTALKEEALGYTALCTEPPTFNTAAHHEGTPAQPSPPLEHFLATLGAFRLRIQRKLPATNLALVPLNQLPTLARPKRYGQQASWQAHAMTATKTLCYPNDCNSLSITA